MDINTTIARTVAERLADEFERYLASMFQRAHKEAMDYCYMQFSVAPARRTDPCRFVQFAFEPDNFQLDLPRQTLSKAEAAVIQSHRQGFFYLSEAPEFKLYGEKIDDSDPFRSIYFYGEERIAAADMAFIIYEAWGISPDSLITVTAASCSGEHRWEDEEPLILPG